MYQSKKVIMVAALFTVWSQFSFAEDTTINRLLASQCAQCHGTYGMAVGEMDGLNDESYKDLVEDLNDMRGEDSLENIMDHQAMGYTQEQIERIARFYDSLKVTDLQESEDEEEQEEDK
ncbi:MAG: hypothetical protein HKP55_05975 [Gammaproteobacteria bacterium]|nr:hypothetical protein [Gammaproteobacteria bacterium]